MKPIAVLVSVLVLLVPAGAHATETAKVLYYDAAHAGEFADNVDRGAANWNSRLTKVHLRQWHAGDPRHITVSVDDGWPRADPGPLGSGTVTIGRRATREGHDPTRIAAHELGHILGLPDRRTGRCADLMSGSSAGTSCTNAYPSAREATTVDHSFD